MRREVDGWSGEVALDAFIGFRVGDFKVIEPWERRHSSEWCRNDKVSEREPESISTRQHKNHFGYTLFGIYLDIYIAV